MANEEKGKLEEFDEWFESVGSNVNSDSSEEEIEETNQQVQEFLQELEDTNPNNS